MNENVKKTNQHLVDDILNNNLRSKSPAINELRHKCTNYDELINTGNLSTEYYQQLAASAKQVVDQLIDESSLHHLNKYVFKLVNNSWDYFKKNDIAEQRR